MSYAMLVTVLCLMSVSMVQGVHIEDALRFSFHRVFDNNAPSDKGMLADRGVVKNCGPNDANFSVEWEPKVIDPKAHNFNSGTFYVKVKKLPDPIFEDSFPVGCDKLEKYIPCPMKAGLPFHRKRPYNDLQILQGYGGDYEAKLQLVNEKNQEMFCALIDFTIKGPD